MCVYCVSMETKFLVTEKSFREYYISSSHALSMTSGLKIGHKFRTAYRECYRKICVYVLCMETKFWGYKKSFCEYYISSSPALSMTSGLKIGHKFRTAYRECYRKICVYVLCMETKFWGYKKSFVNIIFPPALLYR